MSRGMVDRVSAYLTVPSQTLETTDNQWILLLDGRNISGSGDNTSYSITGAAEVRDVIIGWTSPIAIGLLLGSISVITVTGNTLVLVGVLVNPLLRSTTHYFIANLALADLLVGATVLPFSASLEVLNYWAFGQVLCDLWAAVDVLSCTASILSLCVISVDRYVGVTRPLQHSVIMSPSRAGYIVLGVWLASLAISVAPLFGWKQPPSGDPYSCEVTKELGYVLFSVSGSFYIPLTVILLVYYRVYREAALQSRSLATGVKVLRRSLNTGDVRNNGAGGNYDVALRIHTGTGQTGVRGEGFGVGKGAGFGAGKEMESGVGKRGGLGAGRNVAACGGGAMSKVTLANKIAKFQKEKKAAKTLGIVVGVFVLCWFPFFFVLPLEALCPACAPPPWLFKTIFWLGYCNSMMNPIIYACSSREYKRTFISLLRCRCAQGRRNALGYPHIQPRHRGSTPVTQTDVTKPPGRYSRSTQLWGVDGGGDSSDVRRGQERWTGGRSASASNPRPTFERRGRGSEREDENGRPDDWLLRSRVSLETERSSGRNSHRQSPLVCQDTGQVSPQQGVYGGCTRSVRRPLPSSLSASGSVAQIGSRVPVDISASVLKIDIEMTELCDDIVCGDVISDDESGTIHERSFDEEEEELEGKERERGREREEDIVE